jgi:hypothetical protein
MFRSIEKLDLVFGNSYGTHTNIGTINSEFPQMHVLRENRYYISLFKPLSDYLYNHTDDCIKIFGRGFVYYAEELTEYSDSLAHRNFINLQHNTHIKYRINKFINANQYFYSVKLCVELTKCVLTNFCDYVDDYYFEPDKLGHRADITANKLVKIFKKYAEKVDSLDTENESDEW